jgi:glycine dehydrogenase subunit 2
MATLIFQKSKKNRQATSQWINTTSTCDDLKNYLRRDVPKLPEVSELDAVRHYTNLSRLTTSSVDTQFYPLGSCTMKYNPHVMHKLASLPGFANRHPLAHEKTGQGLMACLYDMQEMLKAVTGMKAVTLAPMAGANGEFSGISMIRAYHTSRKDFERTEIIVPDAAHGTNPASAAMCGYTVKEVPTTADGDVNLEALKAAVGPKTAGIMLTNPSTLGVFERRIEDVAKIVHDAGGLLYYDGANLNAILGRVLPGEMLFDVIHMNVHKTFGTPHGGGGPGAGPVAAGDRLKDFLPVPYVAKEKDGYHWVTEKEAPKSIGRLSAFMGNIGILLRGYVYMRMIGRAGMPRVADYACLNSNYLMKQMEKAGFKLALPKRRASHEFIVTVKDIADETGVIAKDFGKRLLDFNIHAPTTYFPMIVPECLLIEPTETESKETLDNFVTVMSKIRDEAKTNPEMVKGAPHTMPVRRLDDVKAARDLNVVYKD